LVSVQLVNHKAGNYSLQTLFVVVAWLKFKLSDMKNKNSERITEMKKKRDPQKEEERKKRRLRVGFEV
jgi:hypothetical protein